MVILSVNPKDEGPYTITATNNQGETVAQAQLLLHVEKPEFVKLPEDQTIHDFADVGVKIRAVGVPTPTLKWLKDGYPIDTNEIDEKTHAPRVSIETSGIKASETQNTSDLTIPHFGSKDVGVVRFWEFLINLFFFLNFCFCVSSTLQLLQMLLVILKLTLNLICCKHIQSLLRNYQEIWKLMKLIN